MFEFQIQIVWLSMRRVEDEEDDQFHESVIKERFRHHEKKKQSSSSRAFVLATIAVFAVALLAYLSTGQTPSEEDSGRVQQLQQQLKKVQSEESAVLIKLDSLQKELARYRAQTQKLSKQSAEIVQTTPKAVQKDTTSKPAAKEEKRQGWMTDELLAISEKRQQKAGMVPIPKGTVRELKLLMKNTQGQGIEDVIYKDDQTRQKRIEFQKQRIAFLQKNSNHQSLGLVKYNMKYDDSYTSEEIKVDQEEYERIRNIHSLDKITQEIPMCLVVPGYNNNAKFRLEYNLNSIFLQNYTNYFVVIINDASTDGSDELFRKYLHFYQIDKTKYAYIQNKVRNTALENIYIATHDFCSEDSVVLNLDGDDEFIGKNVLKIFNAGYQTKKAGVLYSNFYWYEQGGNLMYGFTSEYTDAEKKNNMYRQSPQRFSHLRSYRTELFRKIAAKDFQDDHGKFFTSAYDMAMYFPLMELSCQRVSKIQGYHYLYNINTGLNDYQVDRNKQASIDGRVRGAKKYNCDQSFNRKMEK